MKIFNIKTFSYNTLPISKFINLFWEINIIMVILKQKIMRMKYLNKSLFKKTAGQKQKMIRAKWSLKRNPYVLRLDDCLLRMKIVITRRQT